LILVVTRRHTSMAGRGPVSAVAGRWKPTPQPPLGEQVLAQRKKHSKRDVEKDYPAKQFVAKLRRLADCIEQGERFRIQVAGERVSVPPSATINIEHERGSSDEEIEFQLKWQLDD
jgi:amphi-Trp domain-containing protein